MPNKKMIGGNIKDIVFPKSSIVKGGWKAPKGMSKAERERKGYGPITWKSAGGKMSKYYSKGGTVFTGR
tara:strand:- start:1253 stop:1459 length:207 start_codon:yes stop_codon:yes gene_type:complete